MGGIFRQGGELPRRALSSFSLVFFIPLAHLAYHQNKNSSLQITWVAPRVLTLPQVADLSARLRSWLSKVDAASAALEAEGGVAALAAA